MEMTIFEEMGGTYTQVGDYFLLERYGRLRLQYLKKEKPFEYALMERRGTLFPELRKVDEEAEKMLDRLIPQLAKAAGATEQLKAKDQMRWVGLMNNCRAQAEEIILRELVYV